MATEPAASYELLDPAEITVRNIRDAQPSQQLIDSIGEHGVLQPIGVLRTSDGELVLRFGDRRRKACIELGRQVPAIVLDGTAGTTEAEISRIFEQLDENDNREDLTAGDRATAVAALFELGADARTVARRTGLGKDAIAAARKAAASETARTLAAQYPVTLEQAAVIAEFDDDAETAAQLARAAQDNPGQFDHFAEQARGDRADAAMIAARTAELTAQGITVTDQRLSYEHLLDYLNGPDGSQLTPESHKNCPGAVVLLRMWGYDDRKVEETWYCTDPGKYGHKKRRGYGEPEKNPEEAAAERKKVVEGNKAWRAATAVRQRWLRDVLLARKTLPAGAALFTCQAIAAADSHLIRAMSTMSGGKHAKARELLGGIGKETWNTASRDYDSPLVESLNGVPEQRAQMVTLALVLGAFEEQAADPQTWRTPGRTAQEYLTALAGWEYPLSAAEQAVIDAASGATAAAVGDSTDAATEAEERNGNAA
jgi:ParB family transcriptional regulator, chromosome partitioning protein